MEQKELGGTLTGRFRIESEPKGKGYGEQTAIEISDTVIQKCRKGMGGMQAWTIVMLR